MITPGHPQFMARYNSWQNTSLVTAASALSDDERREDRGAFFRSIAETFAHILWADRMWLSRFDACEAPEGVGIDDSTNLIAWEDFVTARQDTDQILIRWADGLTDQDLTGDLSWYSGAMGRDMSKPRWRIITHMFNHATHHRGQIHAMLTQAGQKPDDTDIPFTPQHYEEL